MASYRLSRPAREDISEILTYIATDSIDAALVLNERLEQTFDILARNPRAGRERPEIAADLRSFPMGSYLILYRVSPSEVFIARVRHSAMDLTEDLEGLN